MIWVLILSLMGVDPEIDGKKLRYPERFQTPEACMAKMQELIETRGMPPGDSTLECRKMEDDSI